MEFYTYYDERYPTSWISKDVGEQIAKYLEKMRFTVVNADELRKVIDNGIREADKEITIVFAQDVVPSILLDNPSNPTVNSLLRKFLNVGHTVVWMGDVPLYYVGFEDGRKQTTPNACQSVLSISANFQQVSNKVRLTFHGKLYGLPEWIGLRPHIGIASGSGLRTIPLALSIHGTQIVNHAFIVSYTGDDFSGFIRIYDFALNKLPSKEYLEGLYRIASTRDPIRLLYERFELLERSLKELRELLETKYNTLKNELDNLGKFLESISSKHEKVK